MLFNRQFISSVVPEARFQGADLPEFHGVAIDTRQLKKGEIFIALKGSKVDGHDFLKEAVTHGAAGVIVQADKESALKALDAASLKKISVIIVPDTKKNLIELATAWRNQFSVPVIGITGSIGKTSTKEMLGNIVRLQGMNLLISEGNQNTALGLSVNMLRMNKDHQIAIFEMGISKRGEMARMASLVQPTSAIITSIGHSHMEGLGSLADIANEKRDIFKYFKEHNIGIINGDTPILATVSYNHPVVKFGCKTTNQVQARKIQTNNTHTHFILKLYKERHKIVLIPIIQDEFLTHSLHQQPPIY